MKKLHKKPRSERESESNLKERPSYDVQRLNRQALWTLQGKFTISEPDDKYEREAEQVADTVMQKQASTAMESQGSLTSDRIQRMFSRSQLRHRHGKPLNCEECKKKLHGRMDGAGNGVKISGGVEQVADMARESGKPLSDHTRSFFETRMGRDFSDVRVHTDSKAAEVARSIDAQAFTVGKDLVFKDEAFRPESHDGRELIAHELAHVVQQHGQGTQPHNSAEELSPVRMGLSPFRGTDVSVSQKLIQRQADVGVENRDVGYGPPAGKPAQRADRPPHSVGDVKQAPDTSIGQILDNFFAPNSSEKMWVMKEGNDYTQIVRRWDPVIKAVNKVKKHLESNCVTWRRLHKTDPSWKPGKTDPPETDPNAYKKWVHQPPGTDPMTCAEAFSAYMGTKPLPFTRGYQSFELYTCAIGSFGIYATVDSINCTKQTAELNIWMYNAMDRKSFGRFKKFFPMSGMKRQYMWWNWSDSHTWGSS